MRRYHKDILRNFNLPECEGWLLSHHQNAGNTHGIKITKKSNLKDYDDGV
jgi:hypothetical protein